MSTTAPRFGLVAGETSGDLLAGLLLGGLRARWPQLVAQGIGGAHMAAQGFEAWWPSERLAVRGYVEVLRHYREITGIRRQLRERLLADPPDVFVGVDAPDFNLDLEAALKARGIPTVHFVSPSIWAWRGKRIERIGRAADLVLCLFPFEPALYERAGLRAAYVGHPLADVIPMQPDRTAARQALGVDPVRPLVALLPGSRGSEITYLGERFARAAALMHRARPDLQFVLPAVSSQHAQVAGLLRAQGLGEVVRLTEGRSHQALAACDVTLIASGTATLEAALFKRPMVIAYNMHWLSWELMRRMRYQPWVGLPNILCESFVVPELLQDAATPEALARETLRWLDDPAGVQALQQRFAALHDTLRCDTATVATDAIQTLLAR